MSSKDIAVSVRSLSKSYTIAHDTVKHTTAREALMHRLKHPLQRVEKETFWALQDVSFDVAQGEVVGIIGRNGAGKSTLLKILSQITEPTTGEIRLYGRVGSLLEVGTGFHPELTGRENIYLNGAILGMKKSEIARQFDAIVDFAGVEQFLDTPVKRYSSGMYVRLAFAVAAHLNPEILIVDEVLAVGDAAFQKKCLGKMKDVAGQGKTILFVSHNVAAIYQLCPQAIFLQDGRLVSQGRTADIVEQYLESGEDSANISHNGLWQRGTEMPSDRGIYFEQISLTQRDGSVSATMKTDEPFFVNITVQASQDVPEAQIAVRFTNQEGVPVFTTAHTDSRPEGASISRGRHRFTFEVPRDFLSVGKYTLLVASMITDREVFDIIERGIAFDVQESTRDLILLRDKRLGVTTPILDWKRTVPEEIPTR